MDGDFSLNLTEIVFLIVALVLTVPFVIFLRWLIKELKRDSHPPE
jgi:hypothetical protein